MDWGPRDFMAPGRSLAVGDRGMVATSHPAATLAGIDVLRGGGNAIDAAIAAVALQGVVDPHMTGIGGDCFVLYAPASGGVPVALNGSGRAPARVDPDRLRARGLAAIPDDSAHAVTVPGAVDAWCRLAADHGTMGIAELFAPAIRAAEEGFLVTPRAARDWQRYGDRIARHGAAVYLPGGSPPRAGDRLVHPALGATLRRIARDGRAGFYEGPVAEEIVSILQGMGSPIELDDFAASEPEYVAPISALYRDARLWECPPNGQGVAALLIARILDGFDLADPALSEADRIHLLAEATKAAYRRRDALVADPAFAPFDVDTLLSDDMVAALRAPITLARALNASRWDLPVHRDTVHVAVVDRDGNAVSFINSLFFAFGSGIYAPRAGVLLQNRGAGFRLVEGHPNVLAPRKRPLHTIVPAILEVGGRAVMPFGVMGGQYQAAGHVQILTGLLDRGLDIQQACDAPRSFALDGTLSLETTIPAAVAEDLANRGHQVAFADEPLGACNAIYIDYARSVLFGASDHRKDGVAFGL
ncbi:MAG TPA: gamma-glutamyltransferase [Beijerinckiaceae bacterium]|nr:gamma-glutamyltransferase [Beijerinckiaceae bacterium]